MDQFVTRSSPKPKKPKNPAPPSPKTKISRILSNRKSTLQMSTIKKINKSTISKAALRSENNPICNASKLDSNEFLNIQSCATGHQTGDGGRRHRASRMTKLQKQAWEQQTGLFKGVVVHINGYSGENIGNLSLIKLVQENGGVVRYTPSGSVTHVITTDGLSGKNTEKYFTCDKISKRVKVVTPAWVTDSVNAGKRARESEYLVFSHDTQTMINTNAFTTGEAALIRSKRRHVSSYTCPQDVYVARKGEKDILGKDKQTRTRQRLENETPEMITIDSSQEKEDDMVSAEKREGGTGDGRQLSEENKWGESEDSIEQPLCGQDC